LTARWSGSSPPDLNSSIVLLKTVTSAPLNL